MAEPGVLAAMRAAGVPIRSAEEDGGGLTFADDSGELGDAEATAAAAVAARALGGDSMEMLLSGSVGGRAPPGSGTVALADFEVLHSVGKGSYGKVFKVVHTGSRNVYALKSVKKSRVLREDAVEMVVREKEVLRQLPYCPFIVHLNFSFYTEAYLFLGMNYVGGGTLKHLLRRSIVLSEKFVRFYAAELVVALEHMHRMNIIHRDVKLENVMIGLDGHIALTDLGMARMIADEDLATTHCGTPEYLSFEIVKALVLRNSKGYGKEVDWWSLGIAIYEMLVGRTPFVAPEKDVEGTVFNIYSHTSIEVPRHIKLSKTVRSLLEMLLVKDPAARLGSGGAAEVKSHPFFKGIDWAALVRKEVTPPHLPRERVPGKRRRGSASTLQSRAEAEIDLHGIDGGDEVTKALDDLNAAFRPYVSREFADVLRRVSAGAGLPTTGGAAGGSAAGAAAGAEETKEGDAAAAGGAAAADGTHLAAPHAGPGRRFSAEVLGFVQKVFRKKSKRVSPVVPTVPERTRERRQSR
eukprot:PLAT4992.3.p1 GENE.PLAT4992.3~~PLAT4992.3.p1  ORF type:complete len:522 (-),score=297.61 PLAT4992.3:287-1852(-)